MRRGRWAAKAEDIEAEKEQSRRREKKVCSLRTLATSITGLRRRVNQDLKSDDEKTRLTALAVAIIDKTAERVGNDDSAKDGHFGVTGFKPSHIEVEGSKVRLTYVGKSGVKHEKEFSDKTVAKLVSECCERNKGKSRLLTTSDGFEIKADKVNRYLSDFEVTAKDLRGYAANNLVVESLKRLDPGLDEKERKKKFSEILNKVAERVGHQRATLKKHYLMPNIEQEYVGKGKIVNLKEASVVEVIVASLVSDEDL